MGLNYNSYNLYLGYKILLTMECYKWIKLLAILLFTIIVIQNTELTTINILFWKVELSRILILVASFIVGTLFGMLTCKKTKNNGSNQ